MKTVEIPVDYPPTLPVCHGERACRFTTCVLPGVPLTLLPGAWCKVIACKLQVFRPNRNITDRTEVYD